MNTVQQVIFYILLVDSIVANIIAWWGRDWYVKHFKTFSRWLPLTRVWATWYLVLVLWIGYLTF